MGKQRIVWIDYAKAVAIFLVVLGHSFNPAGGANLEAKNFIYSFHMPVFFFLSGYLYKRHNGLWAEEYIKNIKSLIVPYFLLSALAGLISFPIFCYSGNIGEMYHRCIETLIGSGNGLAGPAWFLWCLFWVKLISWFALESKRPYLYAILSIALAYLIGTFLWLDVSSAFAAYPFFFIGWILKEKDTINKVKKPLWMILFLTTTPLLICLNKWMGSVSIYSLQFGNYIYLFYFEAFLGVLFFISFIKLICCRNNVITTTISRISILIMALHSAISGYVGVLSKILFLSDDTLLYGVIIAFVEVLILYYPSKIIMKKWPILVGGR